MSSITMAADSTQSELKEHLKGKKQKKREVTKKKKKKESRRKKTNNDSESDYESDLDLHKELKPIGGYISDRELTIEQMFRSISGKKLKAMLPEILKPIPVDELKKLCIEQLDCMSRKRIRRILQGADPETISSSGTEEDSSLSDEDKPKGVSSEEDIHSDNAAGSISHREDNSPVAIHSDDSGGHQYYAPRSRSRSPLSGSGESKVTSRRSSYNSQQLDSDASKYSEEEESDTEVIEEVVYEEIILEDGEDLNTILDQGSYMKGTRDARVRTVNAHEAAKDDEDDDVMVIEREEREQVEVIMVEDEDEEAGLEASLKPTVASAGDAPGEEVKSHPDGDPPLEGGDVSDNRAATVDVTKSGEDEYPPVKAGDATPGGDDISTDNPPSGNVVSEDALMSDKHTVDTTSVSEVKTVVDKDNEETFSKDTQVSGEDALSMEKSEADSSSDMDSADIAVKHSASGAAEQSDGERQSVDSESDLDVENSEDNLNTCKEKLRNGSDKELESEKEDVEMEVGSTGSFEVMNLTDIGGAIDKSREVTMDQDKNDSDHDEVSSTMDSIEDELKDDDAGSHNSLEGDKASVASPSADVSPTTSQIELVLEAADDEADLRDDSDSGQVSNSGRSVTEEAPVNECGSDVTSNSKDDVAKDKLNCDVAQAGSVHVENDTSEDQDMAVDSRSKVEEKMETDSTIIYAQKDESNSDTVENDCSVEQDDCVDGNVKSKTTETDVSVGDTSDVASEKVIKVEEDTDTASVEIIEDDDKVSKKRQRDEELEEGELEDTSSEEEPEIVEKDVIEFEEEVQTVSRPVHRSRRHVSTDHKHIQPHAKRETKKKKVKVIKRIIKVIRRNPKSGQLAVDSLHRDTLTVLKDVKRGSVDTSAGAHAKVKIKKEPGMDEPMASTSKLSSSREQNMPSRSPKSKTSITKSSSNVKVKQEPKSPKGKGQGHSPEKDSSLNKMEILELEMRARAIKAMLKKQEEIDEVKPEVKKKKIKLKR